jgi:hypothetical protein
VDAPAFKQRERRSVRHRATSHTAGDAGHQATLGNFLQVTPPLSLRVQPHLFSILASFV